MNIQSRLKSLGTSQKVGVAALLLGTLGTIMWVQLAAGTIHLTTPPDISGTGTSVVHPKTGVKLLATLSQPKIIQGGEGNVYLDLSVLTPEALEKRVGKLPTDILIVLDRSGSMGEGNKWPYAIRAVHSLLDRLSPNDRIGLITFDSTSRIESALAQADEQSLGRLRRIVDSLAPGASTNLGDALLRAERTISGQPSDRRRRILLLSDGQANVGIVDPETLGSIAKRLADQGNVVSTIGMGLGFNETLMASLADQGMGTFSYMEHLDSLGTILARELSDSRQIYADGSEIRLSLPKGMDLIEASGYPFVLDGKTAVIRTGQLLQESKKRFMVTLRVPSQQIGEYSFGSLELSYRVQGRSFRQEIRPGGLQIACVAPEHREEVIASIDKDVYQEAWTKNNLGSLLRQVGDFVRQGEREKAEQFIDDYRRRVNEADEMVPGVKKKADEELKELEERVDQAFQGSDQNTKQNRAAKSLLDESQQLQRTIKKNQK